MSDKNPTDRRTVSRRKLLGITSASILGLSIPGVGAAKTMKNESDTQQSGSNGASVQITKKTAMSTTDLTREYDQLKRKYGAKTAYQTFPAWAQTNDPDVVEKNGHIQIKNSADQDGISTNAALRPSALLEGVTRVDSWEQHYDVRSSINLHLAATDHYLNLYKANHTDSNGKTIYFWKALDYSQAFNKLAYRSKTDRMTSDLNCTTNDLDLVQGAPEGRVNFGNNNSYIELSAGPATVGSNFGASGGYEQPIPNRLDFGYGGRYAYEVGGGIHGLATGSMILDTRSYGHWAFDWDTHVWASTG